MNDTPLASRIIRRTFAAALIVSAICLSHSVQAQEPAAIRRLPKLQVSENARFLTTGDGSPFFYLGDTAWELLHRLTREEAESYLKRRAEQGYTVIQTVVLAEFSGLEIPNA